MSEKQHWTLDSLPWGEVRRELVADNEELFYMVVSASFIETTSDLYTRNLVQHFAGNEEVSGWLEAGWEPEELQHGRALREYVKHAWPEFDWETQYARLQRLVQTGNAAAEAQPGTGLALRSGDGHRQLLHRPASRQR
jgi:hypothetical protein